MIKKSVLFKFCRKLHKWTGLLLALQVLAWLSGGLVMTAIPRDWVHGHPLVNQQVKEQQAKSLNRTAYQYPVDQLIVQLPSDVQLQSIKFSQLFNGAAYKIKTDKGDWWFDGVTGQQVTAINEAQVRELLTALYAGSGELVELNKLDEGPLEIQRRKNLWQAHYNDWMNTTLYLSAFDGQLIRVRSDIWRFYDFFWMLHIMDYDERSDSHNPLVIAFSIAGVIFTLSGIVLLFQVFKRRDFNLKRVRKVAPI